MIRKTIEGLEKEVEKKKYKAMESRKYAEHFARQMKRSDISERRFCHWKKKEEYWRTMQSNLLLEVEKTENEIAFMKLGEQRKKYRTRLTDFYREAIEYLITLKEAFEKRDIPFACQTVNDFEQIYLEAGSLDKEDLKPISEYLSLQSIKIRIGRIQEEIGEEFKINAALSHEVGAQKRENVKIWIQGITGQIGSCVQSLEKRMKEASR